MYGFDHALFVYTPSLSLPLEARGRGPSSRRWYSAFTHYQLAIGKFNWHAVGRVAGGDIPLLFTFIEFGRRRQSLLRHQLLERRKPMEIVSIATIRVADLAGRGDLRGQMFGPFCPTEMTGAV